MRLTATEKYEITQQVTRSELGFKRTLKEYGIARSTFYKCYQSYLEQGFDGLKPKQKPKLLSDNGLCYVSNELKTYLKDHLKMKQVHGKPMHPQTER